MTPCPNRQAEYSLASPSYDGIDLGGAKRDSDHSLRGRRGVAGWRQHDGRMMFQ